MPSGFWDYVHIGRTKVPSSDEDEPSMRNLQEGLFQIASQTCNILVQVNNTNNISFGPTFYSHEQSGSSYSSSEQPSSSTSMNSMKRTTFFDLEQSVVLLDSSKKQTIDKSPTRTRFSRLSDYKRRLSVSVDSGPYCSLVGDRMFTTQLYLTLCDELDVNISTTCAGDNLEGYVESSVITPCLTSLCYDGQWGERRE